MVIFIHHLNLDGVNIIKIPQTRRARVDTRRDRKTKRAFSSDVVIYSGAAESSAESIQPIRMILRLDNYKESPLFGLSCSFNVDRNSDKNCTSG